MNPSEALYLIVEASLALAGFAGVITVLAKRGASELPRLHRLDLVNLLATSLAALFLSLAALVLLAAGTRDPIVWRVISGVGVLVTLYFGGKSTQTVMATPEGRREGTPALVAINGPLLLVCAAQVWNLVDLGEFWPVLLLLSALFAVGCYAFVRLLFAHGD